jgi:carboxylesterase type B
MSYWANFAKASSPNMPSSMPNLIEWPQYELKTKPYLRFQAPQIRIEQAYNQKDCDVFDSVGYYH